MDDQRTRYDEAYLGWVYFMPEICHIWRKAPSHVQLAFNKGQLNGRRATIGTLTIITGASVYALWGEPPNPDTVKLAYLFREDNHHG